MGRIVHKQDERGVIVDSIIVGDDEKVPEGYGSAGYKDAGEARLPGLMGSRVATGDEVQVAESKLTPWDAKAAKASADAEASEEMNLGTPVQARLQADGEVSKAEKQAAKEIEDAVEETPSSESEVNAGSPVQAKVEAGEKLTESEEKPGEEKSRARRSR